MILREFGVEALALLTGFPTLYGGRIAGGTEGGARCVVNRDHFPLTQARWGFLCVRVSSF